MLGDVAQMEHLIIPKPAIDFVKLLFMYIKRTDEFEKGSERVPASYFFPWTNQLTYANLYSNSDSVVRKLQGYVGLAKIYMDKFNQPGVPFTLETPYVYIEGLKEVIKIGYL
jgi:hypothetical protein